MSKRSDYLNSLKDPLDYIAWYLESCTPGDVEGIVYLLFCGSGEWKIGITSKSVRERVNDHQRSWNVSFEIVYQVKTFYFRDLEKILHAFFDEKRSPPGNEFYLLEPKDIEFIKSIGPDFFLRVHST